jgi:hypothetical protein
MTIWHSLPADFCLRRAVPVQTSSDHQTSSVRASWERPADGRKCLIASMFAAPRSGSVAISPLFSPEKQGRDGCAGAPVRRERRCHQRHKTKLACVKRGVTLPFRRQGKILPCRRSLVTALPDHQPSDQYGRIANEPGSARCVFANLPCRQGKQGKGVGGSLRQNAMTVPHSPASQTAALRARNRESGHEPHHGAGSLARPRSDMRPRVFAHKWGRRDGGKWRSAGNPENPKRAKGRVGAYCFPYASHQKRIGKPTDLSCCDGMVGATGIEPVTPTMST